MKLTPRKTIYAIALLALAAAVSPAYAGCDAPISNWDRNVSFLKYTPFYVESCPMVGTPKLDFSHQNPASVKSHWGAKPYENSAQMLRDAKWVVIAKAVAAHELLQPHAPLTKGEGVVFFKVESILKGQESWGSMPLSRMDSKRQQPHYSGEGSEAKFLGLIPYQHAFNIEALKILPLIRHSPFWEISKEQTSVRSDGTFVYGARYLSYPAHFVSAPSRMPPAVKSYYLDETRPFPYQLYANAAQSLSFDLPYVLEDETYVLVLDAEGYAQNRLLPDRTTAGAPRVEHVGTNKRWLNWVLAHLNAQKTP